MAVTTSSSPPSQVIYQICPAKSHISLVPSPSTGLLKSPSTALFLNELNESQTHTPTPPAPCQYSWFLASDPAKAAHSCAETYQGAKNANYPSHNGPSAARIMSSPPKTTDSPSQLYLDPSIQEEVGWMYEENLFEFDSSELTGSQANSTGPASLDWSQEHSENLKGASPLTSVITNSCSQKSRFSNKNQQTIQKPIPEYITGVPMSPLTASPQHKRAQHGLGHISPPQRLASAPASEIIYSSTEFNHHSFIMDHNTQFLPLENGKDIELGSETNWLDVFNTEGDESGDDESVQHGASCAEHRTPQQTEEPALSKKEPREAKKQKKFEKSKKNKRSKQSERPPHQIAIINPDELVKPVMSTHVSKKSSISSLKEFFKKSKGKDSKSPDTALHSESETSSRRVKKQDPLLLLSKSLKQKKASPENRGSFVVYNTYDHASKRGILPPPIMGSKAFTNSRSQSDSFCKQPPNSDIPQAVKYNNRTLPKHTSHQRPSAYYSKNSSYASFSPMSTNNIGGNASTNGTGTQTKYKINSTPIMNTYMSKKDDTLHRSNSSLASRQPNALIIKVPQSISELNTLVSLHPTPLAKTLRDASLLKSPVLTIQNAGEEKAKSPAFYFVTSFESPSSKEKPASALALRSPEANLLNTAESPLNNLSSDNEGTSSDDSNAATHITTPESYNTYQKEIGTNEILLCSPVSTECSDIKEIRNQYMSEPSPPESSRFSMNSALQKNPAADENSAKKDEFPFNSSMKIQQETFKRRINQSYYDQRDSFTSVNDKNCAYPSEMGNSNDDASERVQVNDRNTVTIRVVASQNSNNSISGSVPRNTGLSVSKEHQGHSQMNNMAAVIEKPTFEQETGLSTIEDADEDLEEDLAAGNHTSLIPDDDLSAIESTLSQGYRAKKQRQKLLEMQEFGTSEPKPGPKPSATPLKYKRMTYSLLYNNFYNDDNANKRTSPYNYANDVMKPDNSDIRAKKVSVVSTRELKCFKEHLGSDLAENRFKKLMDGLEGAETSGKDGSAYFDLRNIEEEHAIIFWSVGIYVLSGNERELSTHVSTQI